MVIPETEALLKQSGSGDTAKNHTTQDKRFSS
jgi:hypothetical protein